MAALVWLYCYIHCGPSWQDPLFALSFNLRGSSRSYTIWSQHWDGGGGGQVLTLQPTWGQTVGGGVCLCVPTEKSLRRPCVWKRSRGPDPCTQPTILTSLNHPSTASLCVFALQTPTSHQNLPALWDWDKETAESKARKVQSLQWCGFLWLKRGGSCSSALWMNTQHISLLCLDLPEPVEHRIQSFTAWLMILR